MDKMGLLDFETVRLSSFQIYLYITLTSGEFFKCVFHDPVPRDYSSLKLNWYKSLCIFNGNFYKDPSLTEY